MILVSYCQDAWMAVCVYVYTVSQKKTVPVLFCE